jgi:hypothetical protein
MITRSTSCSFQHCLRGTKSPLNGVKVALDMVSVGKGKYREGFRQLKGEREATSVS